MQNRKDSITSDGGILRKRLQAFNLLALMRIN